MGKKFNFADVKNIKPAEQELVQGFEQLAEQSGGGDIQGTVPVVQPSPGVAQSGFQEPTQNINIPIPAGQHTRLKIISAQTRQTMKDMVVQAIGLWLDVQEGKVEIKK